MRSIKNDIVRVVTIIPAIILFILFISIDIVLDDWVDSKFNETLITKSNYLKSLIEVDQEGVEFEFTSKFMPEFERKNKPQYFQLWIDGKPFERSTSLDPFPDEQLAKELMLINASKIINMTLPDGRSGKAIMSYFHPQESSRLKKEIDPFEHRVFLTLAVGTDSFSYGLVALDILFWLLFFTLVLGIRYLVIYQIDKGLKPLSLLNEEIAHLKVNKSTSSLKKMPNEHIEIAPVRAELSRYIECSKQILLDEQRLSADIAHELKTPISEIISLSELHIQYPNDKRISESYSEDMLSIAQRMKHIVNNLMILNQEDQYLLKQQNEDLELESAINEILETMQNTNSDIFKRVQIKSLLANATVNIDMISFNLIITNLISNALFYSPAKSLINVHIVRLADGSPQITIENKLNYQISRDQLAQIFKPLYQVDKARTENSRHGLGLAIVEKLSVINNYNIEVSQPENDSIKFSLSLNKYLEKK